VLARTEEGLQGRVEPKGRWPVEGTNCDETFFVRSAILPKVCFSGGICAGKSQFPISIGVVIEIEWCFSVFEGL
jgi:hypothetical protein